MMSRSVSIILLLLSIGYCVESLSVSGNKFIDSSGNAVMLHGVDRPSLEWSSTGESFSPADFAKMASYGFNTVRIPLNQDYMISGASCYDPNYSTLVKTLVTQAQAAGIPYVILDLHWSDQGSVGVTAAQQVMADSRSITFWAFVANLFKGNLNVIFELYNEPHDVTWPIWRNGGTSNGFTVAGMQQLYNAVRTAGANNIVLVGGLNWAYDLSGVASYALTGTNIAYATHPYDYAGKQITDWPGSFGYLAATYPVVMTEFGQYCNSDTYVSDLLAYAKVTGIHWTVWAWYPGGCSFPAIINTWAGDLTPVGTIVYNILKTLVPTSGSTTGTKATTTGSITTGAKATTTGASTTGSVSTTGSKAGTTTTTGSSAGTGVVIFDDTLKNGWQDWSWETVSKTSTTYVYAGQYSIAVTVSAFGGLYFHNPTFFTIGTYSTLQFYVNGGTGTTSQLLVKVYDAVGTFNPLGTAVSFPVSIKANTWSLETISLSAFGVNPSSTLVSGFVFLYNANDTDNGEVFYVDNVSLH